MALPFIVKVGGSLFDLPDLGTRLLQWLENEARAGALLIPGGGAAANVIRELDRAHGLGAEASHWLALRVLQVNAHFLASLLPGARVVAAPAASAPLAILDAYAFAREDERRAGSLPHTWDATSDSLAVRVAQVADARELVLLKSVAWEGDDWAAAVRAGVVDAFFPEIIRQQAEFTARIVHFRAWRPSGSGKEA